MRKMLFKSCSWLNTHSFLVKMCVCVRVCQFILVFFLLQLISFNLVIFNICSFCLTLLSSGERGRRNSVMYKILNFCHIVNYLYFIIICMFIGHIFICKKFLCSCFILTFVAYGLG